MSISLRRLLLSFEGRLPRSTYWLGNLATIGTFAVLFVFLDRVAGPTSTLVLYPPLLWALSALSVKRLHDGGRSAWSLTAAVLPIAGPIWLLIALAFRAGTTGENQYGDDPLTFDADYLTVK